MTINTFSNFSTVSIPEITFIGGTYKELTFDVFDSSGNPVDISSFTYRWVLSPFGQPEIASFSKDGEFVADVTDKNRFIVKLYSYETVLLSSKFVQQPILVGNPGYEFRLGQGYVNIIPAAGLTTINETNTLAAQVIDFTNIVSASVVLMQSQISNMSGSVVALSASAVTAAAGISSLTSSLNTVASQASASIVIVSASITNLNSGWVAAGQTWTYQSASAIIVPSGAQGVYSVGDKVKFTQSSITKYMYVTKVSDTILEVTGGTSASVASETISSNYYSKMQSPVNFPDYFTYTPTGIANSNATVTGRFIVNGRLCNATVRASFSGSITFTGMPSLPIIAGSSLLSTGSAISICGHASYLDAGTATVADTIIPSVVASASYVTIAKAIDGSPITAASPISWANGDALYAQFSYEI